MQNSNAPFDAVRTSTRDSDEFTATSNLIRGLSFKSLPYVIKNHAPDEKIRLITQFLGNGKTENITCKDFAEMVTSIGINDEDKKMKLITEFLGSDKAEIASLKTHNFEDSLNISDNSAKETLSLIKDAFAENNIRAFYQIFNLFQPIFESEGLRANIVENFIINSQRNPISQDEVNRYLIQGFSITNPTYINKINHALQEIYPTQSPVQSIAGSQAGVPETEPTPEEIKQLRAALQFECTDSSGSSQLTEREERMLLFLSNKNPSDEKGKLRERIIKWLNSESEITSSDKKPVAQKNPEITSSTPTKSSPQRQEPEPEPLPNTGIATNITQGQQISSSSKANCCTVS